VIDRTPPHNLDAEHVVLGALLVEAHSTAPIVFAALASDDFYTEAHRGIFRAAEGMYGKGVSIDLITVAAELGGDLTFVGGPAKLAALAEHGAMALPSSLPAHCAIIRDAAQRRRLIQASAQSIEDAYSDDLPATETLDAAERRVFAIAERRAQGSATPVGSLLRGVFTSLEERYTNRESGPVTGVATGFTRLDMDTAGFQPSDLILIAGRPSSGKTALGLNLASHVGIRLKGRVLIMSLEMTSPQLVTRLLCSEAKVDSQAARTGYLTSADWHRLTDAAGRLADAKILIDDSSGLSALEAMAKARRAMAELGGLDLVIIDYLQLMRGAHGNRESRQQEVSDISRALKAMAKELNVPVVALSQLSRATETRPARDHRPQLSDLRESGALEQDSDLVLFLYRAAMYRDDLPPDEQNIAEVIIGKQRNGPTGTVRLVYLAQYTRFENMADPDRNREPF
jgi:replicative DNA helicase